MTSTIPTLPNSDTVDYVTILRDQSKLYREAAAAHRETAELFRATNPDFTAFWLVRAATNDEMADEAEAEAANFENRRLA